MNWIWKKESKKNSFVEFEQTFDYAGGKAELFISADFRYAAYIGEKMVSNGQYADLPDYKSVNKAEITPYIKVGENALRIVAWHLGEDFSICRTMPASIAFEMHVDGKVIASSGENTRCREAKGYLGGDRITPQQGNGFHYDFTAEAEPWEAAVVVPTGFIEVARPIKQTKMKECCVSTIVAQGIFEYYKGETAAEKMQYAWLSSKRFAEMTGENRLLRDRVKEPLTFAAEKGEKIFFVADMGRETCGHLSFSVTVDKDCKMLLGWGEHLTDLRIRTSVGGRNFGMEVRLKAGENILDDYLLRFGCRYICLFVESEKVTVSRLGIREVGYPFRFPKREFGDKLRNAIYEMGRRTLYLSAHEHYEDCPWREQALYGMDSLNQMLFGYGAFEEYEFPRANLRLIAKSMREDGLIELTPPSRMAITIPSFTAYWLIAIGENVKADYDEGFVKEIMPYAEKALDALLSRESDEGIVQFSEIAYWNFHEWSEELDGGEIWRKEPLKNAKGDCNLTALTAIAAGHMSKMYERTGHEERAEELSKISKRIAAYLEGYYDEQRGAYASYLYHGKRNGYHAYTQGVVLWTESVPYARAEALCERLKTEEGLIPATYSALPLKYKAIAEHGGLDYCLKDVEETFSKLLFQGATSYWETGNGEADFDDAGSLCHGWSSVVCYLFDNYL